MQCKEGYPYLSICKSGCQVVSQTFVYANFEFFVKRIPTRDGRESFGKFCQEINMASPKEKNRYRSRTASS